MSLYAKLSHYCVVHRDRAVREGMLGEADAYEDVLEELNSLVNKEGEEYEGV